MEQREKLTIRLRMLTRERDETVARLVGVQQTLDSVLCEALEEGVLATEVAEATGMPLPDVYSFIVEKTPRDSQ